MSKASKKRSKSGLSPPRNPLFNHPLMKKSHVHDKSKKAKRRADKVKFNACLKGDGYYQNSNLLNTILIIAVFFFPKVLQERFRRLLSV